MSACRGGGGEPPAVSPTSGPSHRSRHIPHPSTCGHPTFWHLPAPSSGIQGSLLKGPSGRISRTFTIASLSSSHLRSKSLSCQRSHLKPHTGKLSPPARPLLPPRAGTQPWGLEQGSLCSSLPLSNCKVHLSLETREPLSRRLGSQNTSPPRTLV